MQIDCAGWLSRPDVCAAAVQGQFPNLNCGSAMQQCWWWSILSVSGSLDDSDNDKVQLPQHDRLLFNITDCVSKHDLTHLTTGA
jgi:hypothetical protein